tara:strand:- start:6005 stop:6904 length:900 start_codon:yes stop_codon:yes gene_type:complete
MLAISIRSGWLRYAQADVIDQTLILNSLKNTKLSKEFQNLDMRSLDLSVLFGVILQDVLNSVPDYEKEIYLSLDDRWIDCQIIPIDKGLKVEDQQAYLNWYMQQRLGSLWSSCSIFFSQIESTASDKNWIISSIIAKNALESITSSIKQSGKNPVWLEPSILSMARLVVSEGPGVSFFKDQRSVRALFFFGGNLLAFGQPLIRNGKMYIGSISGDKGLADSIIKMVNALQPRSKKSSISINTIGELPGKWNSYISSRKRHIQRINPIAGIKKGKRIKLRKGTDLSDFTEVSGLMQKAFS